MKSEIENFISSVHNNLDKKLKYLWPAKKDRFPHENNISFSIAEVASQLDLYVYAECCMNDSGARRDIVVVNDKDKWACQIEVKFQQNWDSYEDDFWRVSLVNDFKAFLESDNRQSSSPLKEFKKFGLFIAGGASPLYNCWNEPQSPYKWLNDWFGLKDGEQSIVTKGFYPQTFKTERFGLAYFLIEVTDRNHHDWLNK